MYYGAIEAGGTKFVCAVGDENGYVIDKSTISTRTPNETLSDVFDFFDKYELFSIGIGSFGPIDLNPNSSTYGMIQNTPKIPWKQYDLLQAVKDHYNVPVLIDTDVNVAALGEYTLGAAKNVNNCLYITVGTGIGAGAVLKGETLIGASHPEMGHILVRKHDDDIFKGVCPYHEDCLEGLASGPAIEKRWGEKALKLTERVEVWDLEAYYLAQALMNYILILSPEKIILGGGVMKQKQLFPLVEKHLQDFLGDYIDLDQLSSFIVPPHLKDEAGIKGALMLATKANDLIGAQNGS